MLLACQIERVETQSSHTPAVKAPKREIPHTLPSLLKTPRGVRRKKARESEKIKPKSKEVERRRFQKQKRSAPFSFLFLLFSAEKPSKLATNTMVKERSP